MEQIAIRKLEAIETTATGGSLEFEISVLLPSMKMIFGVEMLFDILPGWMGLAFGWILGPW